MTRTTIHSDYIPDNAITGVKIAENSITAREIATNAITTLYVADDSVTADKLANSINTDIATGVAALPKAGGTMTGNLLVNGITAINKTAVASSVALTINSDASSTSSYGLEVCNATSNTKFLVDGVGNGSFYGSNNAITARFTSDNKVGIGTIAPAYKLDVQDTNDPAQIRLKEDGNTNGFIFKNYNGNEAQLVNADNGPMVFKTNDTERMRIDSAGTMFLGTTSPTLHSATRGIVFENGSLLTDVTRGAGKSMTLAQNASVDSGNTWAYLATDEASYYQQFGGNHYFGTAPSGSAGADTTFTTRMFIANTGNVGIGENSPDRQLHVKSGTANVVAKFESTDSIAAIEFTDSGGSAEIGCDGSDVVLFPAGSEKFRVQNSTGYLVAQSASQVRLVLGSTGNSSNNTSNWIRGTGNELGLNSGGGNIGIEIGGSAKATINSTGQILLNSLATSTPTFSFINDPDTGMSRPTTNAINFCTAGAERCVLMLLATLE